MSSTRESKRHRRLKVTLVLLGCLLIVCVVRTEFIQMNGIKAGPPKQLVDPDQDNGLLHDQAEATERQTHGADEGAPETLFNLGLMYYEGEGLPQNYRKAAQRYTQAAQRGFVKAQFNLGLMYYKGEGLLQDCKEAAKWFMKAAEQGHVQAQVNLSVMYYEGTGVPQDYEEAVKWLRKAAEQGCAEAQYNLGVMYYRERGVRKDHEEAGRWYTKAAEQGDAEAQFNLGLMYYNGEGFQRDYREAAKWYTKAAAQGLVKAQSNLGLMYYEGEGVPKDHKEAAKWFMKAAEGGQAIAQFNLGLMYYKGEGLSQDYKEAAKWFTKAAKQGEGRAQFKLGLMHLEGKGVLEDYVEAYKWVLLAAMNGTKVADDFKEILRERMTLGQIEAAQREAKEFLTQQERHSGRDRQGAETVTCTATGFFITSDGYILTACHAVDGVTRVEASWRDMMYSAKVIFKDDSTDTALLKIEGHGFACLPLVSSTTVKTGDPVFTVGFPQVSIQGAEAKFTEGSVSSLSGMGNGPRFLQISVPIQPGNSGGPLVNDRGEVIGLVLSSLDDVGTLLATGSVPQTVNYALKTSFILPLVHSIPDIAEKLARPSSVKDRSGAIKQAKESVLLIVGSNDPDGLSSEDMLQ